MSDPAPVAPAGGGSSGAGGGRVLLVRHAQTPWSVSGRHTGSTDVPLTALGREQAAGLGPLLGGLLGGSEPVRVLSSPRVRAVQTAELAGLGRPLAQGGVGGPPVQVEADLAEWDYGAYEGMTTAQIRELRGDDWRVFRDGVVGGGQRPGESLGQVAARAARVLERVGPDLRVGSGEHEEHGGRGGDVVLVSHGHLLRVLAAVWLQAPPAMGAQLLLETAAVCVLDREHGVPGVRRWNVTAQLLAPGALGGPGRR